MTTKAVYREVGPVGIGVSIFLMAVGAHTRLGVNVEARGLNLDVIGVILMVMGGIGLLLSLLFWSSFAPFGRREELVLKEPDFHHHH